MLAHRIIIIIFVLLIGSVQAVSAEQRESSPIVTKMHLDSSSAKVGDDYRLGPGDVISIMVESIPEISKTYTVLDTGTIVFPTLLSALEVQGLTVEELQSLLVKILAEYMHEPNVKVGIVEYHSHKILLLGPFQNQGKYVLKKERVPLLDIIMETGGVRELKDNDELVILRHSSSNPSGNGTSELMQPIRVNLKKLLRDGDLSQNVMIQAGDVVYLTSFFSAGQYVYVTGGGHSRGTSAIPYEQGLTAFKALLRAGVPTDDRRALDLVIVRRQSGGEQFIPAQLKLDPTDPNIGDIALSPEDILILPDTSLNVVYVTGEVNRTGTVPYREGLTVLQAILDAGGMTKGALGNKVKVLREDAHGRKQIPVDMEAVLEKGDKSQNITLVSGDIIYVPGMTLQSDIMVTGKVNNPRMVPYEEGMTATKAIYLAGGLSNNELKSQIRIMKRNGDVLPAFLLDLSTTQPGEPGSSNPILEPGDLMVVLGPAPGNIVYVLGKVQRPGVLPFEEGLTLLQAILNAGGFAGGASSKVKVMRGEGDQQKTIRVDLGNLVDKGDRSKDIPLMPGDIVHVPETFF